MVDGLSVELVGVPDEPEEPDALDVVDESELADDEPELLAGDPDLSEFELSEELLPSAFFSLASPVPFRA